MFTLANVETFFPPAFAPQGDRITWGSSSEKTVSLWDLDGPPDADPIVLRRPDPTFTKQGVFHPGGQWLAVVNHESLTLWAVGQPQVRILRGHTQTIGQIIFTADSKWLLSCAMAEDGRIWPLEPQLGVARTLGESFCYGVAVDPRGEKILVGQPRGADLVPFSGGEGQPLIHFDKEYLQTGHSIAGLAFDASGRRMAASSRFSQAQPPRQMVYEWGLDAGTSRQMSLLPDGETSDGAYDWNANFLEFTLEGDLLAAGRRGIRRLDLDARRSEWIRKLDKDEEAVMSISADGGPLLAAARRVGEAEAPARSAVLFDLEQGTEQEIPSHGNRVWSVALDRSGRTIVTGDREGTVRVSSMDGGEPHLLLGHSDPVEDVAVSPDGRWIASAAGAEIRLWPMPDLEAPPLHTLTRDELLSKLSELTNLEVVEDEDAPTGFRLVTGPFLGWAEMPKW